MSPLPLPPVTDPEGRLDPGAVQFALDQISKAFPLASNLQAYPVVTALPTTGTNGQVIDYLADSTKGVVWRLKYRSASSSAYKWEFVGGPPLYDEITAAQTTVSAAYVALATAGPSIAVPLAGDFDVEIGSRIHNQSAAADVYMSYDIGATGAVDADSLDTFQAAANQAHNDSRKRRKTGLTAVTLTAKYRTTAGTGEFRDRWMTVLPVRVG